MKFLRPATLVTGVFLLLPTPALAELPSVRVVVNDISPLEGIVEVSLFDSEESFMKEALLQQSGTPDENGRFETRFVSLVEGEYAVVVVHDANNNGKLDTGFLGFGGESFAYSNNTRQWFTRPDFEKVKVSVDTPDTLVEINLD